MRALRFSIGFPPLIARKTVRDTEYALGLIPLGGYVKIPGMLRPEAEDLWGVATLLEHNDDIPADLAAAIGVSYDDLCRMLSQGRYSQAGDECSRLRTLVEEAQPHMGAAELKRAMRSIDRVQEALDPRGYWRSPRRKRLIVILAGPVMNLVIAFVVLFAVAATGMPQAAKVTPRVALVYGGSPAHNAGLRTGDRIVAIDGQTAGPERIRSVIMASNGSAQTLTVIRDGKRVVLRAEKPVIDQGSYKLGFGFGTKPVPSRTFSVLRSPGEAASQMWAITSGTFSALGQIGSAQGRSQFSGPIGIVHVSAESAQRGAAYYFYVFALISLSLGIFNLLPFLPLDGGHVLFILLEWLRGRPMSRGVFERVSAIGIVLMLIVFVIGLNNDLSSPFGSPGK
jgi:regulator of sigma E protease